MAKESEYSANLQIAEWLDAELAPQTRRAVYGVDHIHDRRTPEQLIADVKRHFGGNYPLSFEGKPKC
jgi:hypothetical protein